MILAALAFAQAIAIVPSPGLVFADGNQLHEQCQSNSPFCVGYVMGVMDAHEFAVEVDHVRRRVCVATSVNAQQLADVVALYLREHPESRQLTATSLAMVALEQAYPCPAQ
jgi:hypothetical protein